MIINERDFNPDLHELEPDELDVVVDLNDGADKENIAMNEELLEDSKLVASAAKMDIDPHYLVMEDQDLRDLAKKTVPDLDTDAMDYIDLAIFMTQLEDTNDDDLMNMDAAEDYLEETGVEIDPNDLEIDIED